MVLLLMWLHLPIPFIKVDIVLYLYVAGAGQLQCIALGQYGKKKAYCAGAAGLNQRGCKKSDVKLPKTIRKSR